MSHPAVFTINPADGLLDIAAHALGVLHSLARRGSQLHHDDIVSGNPTIRIELLQRAQPHVYALGVVEPVDSQQDSLWIAELSADLLGALPDRLAARHLVQRVGVNGDREGADSHSPAVEVDFAKSGTYADA